MIDRRFRGRWRYDLLYLCFERLRESRAYREPSTFGLGVVDQKILSPLSGVERACARGP